MMYLISTINFNLWKSIYVVIDAMRQKVLAVTVVTALFMTAIIYTSPSGDSIAESQPPELLITPDNNIIVFPKGGGYDENFWMNIQAEHSIVEASINLIGLDVLDSTQLMLYELVSSDINDDVSTAPQIITDIYNNHFVAWIDSGSIQSSKAGLDVFLQQWDSQLNSWKTPVQLSANAPNTDAKGVKLATDSTGNVYVVWVEGGNALPSGGADNEIFFRKWNGNSWSPIELVSDDIDDDDSISPDIVVDMYGNVFVAWSDNGDIKSSGTDYDIVYKVFNGTVWSATDVVSTDPDDGDSKEPALATDGSNVFFCWADNGNITSSGTDYDIVLRTYRQGSLDLPYLISNDINDGESVSPDLCANSTHVFVVWQDNGSVSGSGLDSDIVISTYETATNKIGMASVISDHAYDGESEKPQVVIDNFNNIYIAWSDSGAMLSSGSDWDIFYRLIDSFGMKDIELLTTDTTPGISEAVSLTVDFRNHVQIAWQDTADVKGSGVDEDIFLKDLYFDYEYPKNPKIDFGKDGSWDWELSGVLDYKTEISGDWLGLKLTSLVNAGKDNAVSGYVQIPWRMSSDSTGAINISHIFLRGTKTPLAPGNLTILNEDIMHVVDHKPTFSWDFIDQDSPVQGRFEVEVGSSPGNNDMWDPVPAESPETQIKYMGSNLIDGQTYYFRVRVADSEGSEWSDWSVPLQFRINTPPEITSFKPTTGTFDEKIELTWSAADAETDGLLYYVQVYYNQDEVWQTIVDGSPETSYTWLTKNVYEQTIVFNIFAWDGFENSTNFEPSGPFYIGHNTPPRLQIISPKVDIKLGEKEVYLIEWNGTDDDEEDVLTISLFYDDDKNESDKQVIVEDYPNTKKYQWDTTDVQPDEYYILGIITDGINSTSAYSEGTIEVGLDKKILPPTVTYIEPEVDEEKVELKPMVRIVFNKVLNESTINHETFYIKDENGILVEGEREYYPLLKELRFTLKSTLKFSTEYTVIITHKLKDTDGVFFDGNYNGVGGEGVTDDFSWSFRTLMKEDDNSPPTVLSTKPTIDEMGVDVKTTIQINFSEPIDPTTLYARTFMLITLDKMLEWDGVSIDWLVQNSIDGSVSYSIEKSRAIFTPASSLEFNTTYVVLLMPQISDLSDNNLAGNYELVTQIDGIIYPYAYSFTTVPEQIPANEIKKDQPVYVEIFNWEYFYYLFIVLLILVILVIAWLIRRKVLMGPIQIRDVFIIYNDGRLLYHYRPKSDKVDWMRDSEIDEGAVSSMLTAIQDFVKDSFRFSMGSRLNELRHGTLRILIEHGNDSYVAVVCSGGPTSKIRDEMKNVIYDLNVKYGKVLKDWDGNMNTIAGIDKLVVPLVLLEKDAELSD